MIIIVDFIKELLIVPYTPSSEKMSKNIHNLLYIHYIQCCTDDDCTENRIISILIRADEARYYITGDGNERLYDVSKYQGPYIYVVISGNLDDDNGYCKLEHNIYLDETEANSDFFSNNAKYKSIKKFEIPFEESYTKSAMKIPFKESYVKSAMKKK